MGREVRKVPAAWEHPKDERGRSKPLYDDSFAHAAREWMDKAMAWDSGDVTDSDRKYRDEYPFYWQWSGGPPKEEYYRPEWTDAERTHFQMYETVSEGTPISPPMESPEALAHWLADSGANAGAGETASYEAWLRVCNGGYAPSMVITNGHIQNGVEALL